MKVRVLAHICRGHSMCALACPDIFIPHDETGHATVAAEIVPPHLEQAVLKAKLSCPEEAIEVTSGE